MQHLKLAAWALGVLAYTSTLAAAVTIDGDRPHVVNETAAFRIGSPATVLVFAAARHSEGRW